MSIYNIKTVAITGATSSLGIAVIKECIENEIDVIAFLHRNSKNESRVPDSKLVRKVYCSLEEMENFDVGKLTADAFIHLAWGHTNRSVRNEVRPQIDNIKYSIDSVILADKMKCKVYVGAGSQAEYGRRKDIINEMTSVNPETAYGMAKLCSSQMTRLECKKRGMRHVWPRIFSTYGPNTQDTSILNYTINQLLQGKKPSLTGCDQIWDFLFVEDAARALLLLADHGKDGEIYCIASGKSKTMREYIEITKKIIDPELSIGYGDIPYDENTVMHLEADISKIRNEIGFVPGTGFEKGIKRTIDWACDNSLKQR